ncbi:hypothetical protein [Neobacillus cucumis]|uniref:hypothetical protein n=1 Tax=Neobacillus cucumis TaxID=1740721 RepID=UPI0028530EA5|nr:hypothetical protein [Neobacillus cucumis]MDR4948982.1 hypothetical protein [Neobacillus cucumis]
MEINQIASFVVRIQLSSVENGPSRKQWRIKVTHVQEESESLFESLEDAMEYMKNTAEKA